MSEFRSFRIGWNLFDDSRTDFYFKVEDGEQHVLCNFCIAKEGLYYYKAGSRILSNTENENTRNSWDGFLSFEKLDNLFKKLDEIGCSCSDGDDSLLNIEMSGAEIIISKG